MTTAVVNNLEKSRQVNANFDSVLGIELIGTLSSSAANFLPLWPLSFVEVAIVIETHRRILFLSIFLQVQLQLAGLCFSCD